MVQVQTCRHVNLVCRIGCVAASAGLTPASLLPQLVASLSQNCYPIGFCIVVLCYMFLPPVRVNASKREDPTKPTLLGPYFRPPCPLLSSPARILRGARGVNHATHANGPQGDVPFPPPPRTHLMKSGCSSNCQPCFSRNIDPPTGQSGK